MKIKQITTLALFVVAVFIAAFATTESSAVSTPTERMTSYHTPTGPEITSAAAIEMAVSREARQSAGVIGALQVTTVHANVAEAIAVAEGRSPSEALYGGPADVAEWRTAPAFMVSMRSLDGEYFHPNVPHPPRAEVPSGPVMTIIVDAHTGWRLGLNISPDVPPAMSQLGTELRTKVPAIPRDAIAAKVPLGDFGSLVGHLQAKKHPAVGWHIVISHESPIRRALITHKTFQDGIFTFRLVPGTYHVAARNPKGILCGEQLVRISRHKETTVNVAC